MSACVTSWLVHKVSCTEHDENIVEIVFAFRGEFSV